MWQAAANPRHQAPTETYASFLPHNANVAGTTSPCDPCQRLQHSIGGLRPAGLAGRAGGPARHAGRRYLDFRSPSNLRRLAAGL